MKTGEIPRDHADGSQNAIDVEGLVKRYGDVAAVDGVSFSVAHGEFFGLLGPNGAGKTTTLEMIEGLRQPDAGQVRVFGESPWPRNPKLLPRIGVQLQSTAFFDRMTTKEQLETFAQLYGVPAKRVDEMLELVGLTDKKDVQAEKLSGGQAQRLSIACALVHDPDLVFLDEPTAALDPQARRNLWDVLREINQRGKTVVLTTHYMDEAEILCDRVAIIDHGRVLRQGTPSALIRDLDAPVRIAVERNALDVDTARTLPGAADATDDGTSTVITTSDAAPVLTALAQRDALHGLQVHGATLEDVFLELTGREFRA